jgi:hypothetical protein
LPPLLPLLLHRYSCYKHRFEKGSIDFSYSQKDLAQFYNLCVVL